MQPVSEVIWYPLDLFFGESGLIDMVPKDTDICVKQFTWLQLITGTFYTLQELQLIFSLLHQGIKVDVARSADSPDKKKTSFLFLWLQQPLRKI